MSKSLQAIRGMNDILPEQTPAWRYLERTFAGLLDGYGYSEIRLPILEFTELFARGIGEGTDVVDKEMYTFLDRNGESLTMRPEGTAGCVRAVLEHGLSGGGQVQKLWYTGPMFRYEKPQKGRYRQFHQIGVEVFNLPGPDIDAELIILTWRLWQKLGMADAVTLQLNTLGSSEARAGIQLPGDCPVAAQPLPGAAAQQTPGELRPARIRCDRAGRRRDHVRLPRRGVSPGDRVQGRRRNHHRQAA